MMMQVHVVERAEQDAPIDIGAAAVRIRVDVVRLAVRGGSVAVGDAASAITDRQRDALCRAEQSCFAAEVERIAGRVEGDGDRRGVAGSSRDDPAWQRRTGVFDEGDRRPSGHGAVVGILGGDDADAGLSRAEHRRGVGERAGPDDVHDQVVGDLIVRARIVGELLSPRRLVGIDEARSAATRAQRGGDDGVDADGADVVEREAAAAHAVAVGPGAEGARVEPLVEAALRAVGVEQVADYASSSPEFFDGAHLRFIDQLLCRERPRVARRRIVGVFVVDARGRIAETAEDGVVLRGRQRAHQHGLAERGVPGRRSRRRARYPRVVAAGVSVGRR